jgi:hypothetical protein
MASLPCFLLGILWHPALLLVAVFCLAVAGGSAYVAQVRAREAEDAESSVPAVDMATAIARQKPAAAKAG